MTFCWDLMNQGSPPAIAYMSAKKACLTQKQKDDLWWALNTRVLTPSEMETVRAYGTSLLTRTMLEDGWGEDSKPYQARFEAALQNQAQLQIMAGRR